MNRRIGKRKRRMIDSPDQKPSADGPAERAQDQANRAPNVTVANAVSSHDKPDSKKQEWWKEPQHWIQGGTLLFVGVYTVLTFLLLQTTKETNKAQSRAYVLSNSMRLITYGAQMSGAMKEPSPQESPRWILTPTIENTGNTPTKNLMFSSETTIVGDFKGAWFDHNPPNKFSPALIGPKAEVQGGVFILGPNELIQLQQRKALVGGGVIAKYDDVFNNRHLSEACYVAEIVPIDFQHYPIGQPIRLETIPCERHNCIDDECGADWLERARK